MPKVPCSVSWEDLKHYPKRNGVRQEKPVDESMSLKEMWEAEG